MKEFRSFTKEIVQDVSYTPKVILKRTKPFPPSSSSRGKWINGSLVRTPNTRSQKSSHLPTNKRQIESLQSNSLRTNRTYIIKYITAFFNKSVDG